MACWIRRTATLLIRRGTRQSSAPCVKRRDAPLDCPRATETDVKWTFHDARRTDNGDRYFSALSGGTFVARSRGPQGNVLWGDGSGAGRAPCGDAAHNVAALHVPGLRVVLLGGRSSQKDVRRRLAGTCPAWSATGGRRRPRVSFEEGERDAALRRPFYYRRLGPRPGLRRGPVARHVVRVRRAALGTVFRAVCTSSRSRTCAWASGPCSTRPWT